MTRFRLDPTYARHDRVVIAGSPLRLFRLGPAGVGVVTRLERGDAVAPSPLIDRLADAGAIHPVARVVAGPHHDVTVVVPVKDAPPPDRATLGPVARALVVDDGSHPAVPGAEVRLARTAGPAAARNGGLAAVTTPLVAFVDADVELPGGWLDGLVGHFDDPAVGLVAPRVRSRPGPGILARYERVRSPLDLGAEPARVRAGTRISYVPAAAVVARVAALRAAGGFDPTLRFGEDVDLVWRLDAAGWRIRYEPRVTVEHRPRPTWSAWARQRVGYGASAAPLALRHPGALAPARMHGWTALAWSLGIAGHPVGGAAVAIGSALALTDKLSDVPAETAFGLAARGTAHAGRSLAAAARRVWWPLLAVAALRSRRARRLAALALLTAGHPLRAVDDLAYGVGVWRSMVRTRTWAPLLPGLTAWPGRSRAGR